MLGPKLKSASVQFTDEMLQKLSENPEAASTLLAEAMKVNAKDGAAHGLQSSRQADTAHPLQDLSTSHISLTTATPNAYDDPSATNAGYLSPVPSPPLVDQSTRGGTGLVAMFNPTIIKQYPTIATVTGTIHPSNQLTTELMIQTTSPPQGVDASHDIANLMTPRRSATHTTFSSVGSLSFPPISNSSVISPGSPVDPSLLGQTVDPFPAPSGRDSLITSPSTLPSLNETGTNNEQLASDSISSDLSGRPVYDQQASLHVPTALAKYSALRTILDRTDMGPNSPESEYADNAVDHDDTTTTATAYNHPSSPLAQSSSADSAAPSHPHIRPMTSVSIESAHTAPLASTNVMPATTPPLDQSNKPLGVPPSSSALCNLVDTSDWTSSLLPPDQLDRLNNNLFIRQRATSISAAAYQPLTKHGPSSRAMGTQYGLDRPPSAQPPTSSTMPLSSTSAFSPMPLTRAQISPSLPFAITDNIQVPPPTPQNKRSSDRELSDTLIVNPDGDAASTTDSESLASLPELSATVPQSHFSSHGNTIVDTSNHPPSTPQPTKPHGSISLSAQPPALQQPKSANATSSHPRPTTAVVSTPAADQIPQTPPLPNQQHSGFPHIPRQISIDHDENASQQNIASSLPQSYHQWSPHIQPIPPDFDKASYAQRDKHTKSHALVSDRLFDYLITFGLPASSLSQSYALSLNQPDSNMFPNIQQLTTQNSEADNCPIASQLGIGDLKHYKQKYSPFPKILSVLPHIYKSPQPAVSWAHLAFPQGLSISATPRAPSTTHSTVTLLNGSRLHATFYQHDVRHIWRTRSVNPYRILIGLREMVFDKYISQSPLYAPGSPVTIHLYRTPDVLPTPFLDSSTPLGINIPEQSVQISDDTISNNASVQGYHNDEMSVSQSGRSLSPVPPVVHEIGNRTNKRSFLDPPHNAYDLADTYTNHENSNNISYEQHHTLLATHPTVKATNTLQYCYDICDYKAYVQNNINYIAFLEPFYTQLLWGGTRPQDDINSVEQSSTGTITPSVDNIDASVERSRSKSQYRAHSGAIHPQMTRPVSLSTPIERSALFSRMSYTITVPPPTLSGSLSVSQVKRTMLTFPSAKTLHPSAAMPAHAIKPIPAHTYLVQQLQTLAQRTLEHDDQMPSSLSTLGSDVSSSPSHRSPSASISSARSASPPASIHPPSSTESVSLQPSITPIVPLYDDFFSSGWESLRSIVLGPLYEKCIEQHYYMQYIQYIQDIQNDDPNTIIPPHPVYDAYKYDQHVPTLREIDMLLYQHLAHFHILPSLYGHNDPCPSLADAHDAIHDFYTDFYKFYTDVDETITDQIKASLHNTNHGQHTSKNSTVPKYNSISRSTDPHTLAQQLMSNLRYPIPLLIQSDDTLVYQPHTIGLFSHYPIQSEAEVILNNITQLSHLETLDQLNDWAKTDYSCFDKLNYRVSQQPSSSSSLYGRLPTHSPNDGIFNLFTTIVDNHQHQPSSTPTAAPAIQPPFPLPYRTSLITQLSDILSAKQYISLSQYISMILLRSPVPIPGKVSVYLDPTNPYSTCTKDNLLVYLKKDLLQHATTHEQRTSIHAFIGFIEQQFRQLPLSMHYIDPYQALQYIKQMQLYETTRTMEIVTGNDGLNIVDERISPDILSILANAQDLEQVGSYLSQLKPPVGMVTMHSPNMHHITSQSVLNNLTQIALSPHDAMGPLSPCIASPSSSSTVGSSSSGSSSSPILSSNRLSQQMFASHGIHPVTVSLNSLRSPLCSNFPLYILFNTLSINHILLLLSALLLERRVVIYSQNTHRIPIIMYSLIQLLDPLPYDHILIPVLPISMTSAVLSPMPFFIGMHTTTLITLEPSNADELVLFNMDVPEFKYKETLPRLPSPYIDRLSLALSSTYHEFKCYYESLPSMPLRHVVVDTHPEHAATTLATQALHFASRTTHTIDYSVLYNHEQYDHPSHTILSVNDINHAQYSSPHHNIASSQLPPTIHASQLIPSHSSLVASHNNTRGPLEQQNRAFLQALRLFDTRIYSLFWRFYADIFANIREFVLYKGEQPYLFKSMWLDYRTYITTHDFIQEKLKDAIHIYNATAGLKYPLYSGQNLDLFTASLERLNFDNRSKANMIQYFKSALGGTTVHVPNNDALQSQHNAVNSSSRQYEPSFNDTTSSNSLLDHTSHPTNDNHRSGRRKSTSLPQQSHPELLLQLKQRYNPPPSILPEEHSDGTINLISADHPLSPPKKPLVEATASPKNSKLSSTLSGYFKRTFFTNDGDLPSKAPETTPSLRPHYPSGNDTAHSSSPQLVSPSPLVESSLPSSMPPTLTTYRPSLSTSVSESHRALDMDSFLDSPDDEPGGSKPNSPRSKLSGPSLTSGSSQPSTSSVGVLSPLHDLSQLAPLYHSPDQIADSYTLQQSVIEPNSPREEDEDRHITDPSQLHVVQLDNTAPYAVALTPEQHDNIVAQALSIGPSWRDDDDNTILHLLWDDTKNAHLAQKLLSQKRFKSLINTPNAHKQTPIMFVVQQRNSHQILSIMIKAGADVNAQDSNGHSVLFYACVGVLDPIYTLYAHILVDAGASPLHIDNNGNTILHMTRSDCFYPFLVKIFDDEPSIQSLVDNKNSQGHTPLGLLYLSGIQCPQYTKFLLDQGATTDLLPVAPQDIDNTTLNTTPPSTHVKPLTTTLSPLLTPHSSMVVSPRQQNDGTVLNDASLDHSSSSQSTAVIGSPSQYDMRVSTNSATSSTLTQHNTRQQQMRSQRYTSLPAALTPSHVRSSNALSPLSNPSLHSTQSYIQDDGTSSQNSHYSTPNKHDKRPKGSFNDNLLLSPSAAPHDISVIHNDDTMSLSSQRPFSMSTTQPFSANGMTPLGANTPMHRDNSSLSALNLQSQPSHSTRSQSTLPQATQQDSAKQSTTDSLYRHIEALRKLTPSSTLDQYSHDIIKSSNKFYDALADSHAVNVLCGMIKTPSMLTDYIAINRVDLLQVCIDAEIGLYRHTTDYSLLFDHGIPKQAQYDNITLDTQHPSETASLSTVSLGGGKQLSQPGLNRPLSTPSHRTPDSHPHFVSDLYIYNNNLDIVNVCGQSIIVVSPPPPRMSLQYVVYPVPPDSDNHCDNSHDDNVECHTDLHPHSVPDTTLQAQSETPNHANALLSVIQSQQPDSPMYVLPTLYPTLTPDLTASSLLTVVSSLHPTNTIASDLDSFRVSDDLTCEPLLHTYSFLTLLQKQRDTVLRTHHALLAYSLATRDDCVSTSENKISLSEEDESFPLEPLVYSGQATYPNDRESPDRVVPKLLRRRRSIFSVSSSVPSSSIACPYETLSSISESYLNNMACHEKAINYINALDLYQQNRLNSTCGTNKESKSSIHGFVVNEEDFSIWARNAIPQRLIIDPSLYINSINKHVTSTFQYRYNQARSFVAKQSTLLHSRDQILSDYYNTALLALQSLQQQQQISQYNKHTSTPSSTIHLHPDINIASIIPSVHYELPYVPALPYGYPLNMSTTSRPTGLVTSQLIPSLRTASSCTQDIQQRHWEVVNTGLVPFIRGGIAPPTPLMQYVQVYNGIRLDPSLVPPSLHSRSSLRPMTASNPSSQQQSALRTGPSVFNPNRIHALTSYNVALLQQIYLIVCNSISKLHHSNISLLHSSHPSLSGSKIGAGGSTSVVLSCQTPPRTNHRRTASQTCILASPLSTSIPMTHQDNVDNTTPVDNLIYSQSMVLPYPIESTEKQTGEQIVSSKQQSIPHPVGIVGSTSCTSLLAQHATKLPPPLSHRYDYQYFATTYVQIEPQPHTLVRQQTGSKYHVDQVAEELDDILDSVFTGRDITPSKWEFFRYIIRNNETRDFAPLYMLYDEQTNQFHVRSVGADFEMSSTQLIKTLALFKNPYWKQSVIAQSHVDTTPNKSQSSSIPQTPSHVTIEGIQMELVDVPSTAPDPDLCAFLSSADLKNVFKTLSTTGSDNNNTILPATTTTKLSPPSYPISLMTIFNSASKHPLLTKVQPARFNGYSIIGFDDYPRKRYDTKYNLHTTNLTGADIRAMTVEILNASISIPSQNSTTFILSDYVRLPSLPGQLLAGTKNSTRERVSKHFSYFEKVLERSSLSRHTFVQSATCPIYDSSQTEITSISAQYHYSVLTPSQKDLFQLYPNQACIRVSPQAFMNLLDLFSVLLDASLEAQDWSFALILRALSNSYSTASAMIYDTTPSSLDNSVLSLHETHPVNQQNMRVVSENDPIYQTALSYGTLMPDNPTSQTPCLVPTPLLLPHGISVYNATAVHSTTTEATTGSSSSQQLSSRTSTSSILKSGSSSSSSSTTIQPSTTSTKSSKRFFSFSRSEKEKTVTHKPSSSTPMSSMGSKNNSVNPSGGDIASCSGHTTYLESLADPSLIALANQPVQAPYLIIPWFDPWRPPSKRYIILSDNHLYPGQSSRIPSPATLGHAPPLLLPGPATTIQASPSQVAAVSGQSYNEKVRHSSSLTPRNGQSSNSRDVSHSSNGSRSHNNNNGINSSNTPADSLASPSIKPVPAPLSPQPNRQQSRASPIIPPRIAYPDITQLVTTFQPLSLAELQQEQAPHLTKALPIDQLSFARLGQQTIIRTHPIFTRPEVWALVILEQVSFWKLHNPHPAQVLAAVNQRAQCRVIKTQYHETLSRFKSRAFARQTLASPQTPSTAQRSTDSRFYVINNRITPSTVLPSKMYPNTTELGGVSSSSVFRYGGPNSAAPSSSAFSSTIHEELGGDDIEDSMLSASSSSVGQYIAINFDVLNRLVSPLLNVLPYKTTDPATNKTDDDANSNHGDKDNQIISQSIVNTLDCTLTITTPSRINKVQTVTPTLSVPISSSYSSPYCLNTDILKDDTHVTHAHLEFAPSALSDNASTTQALSSFKIGEYASRVRIALGLDDDEYFDITASDVQSALVSIMVADYLESKVTSYVIDDTTTNSITRPLLLSHQLDSAHKYCIPGTILTSEERFYAHHYTKWLLPLLIEAVMLMHEAKTPLPIIIETLFLILDTEQIFIPIWERPKMEESIFKTLLALDQMHSLLPR